MARLGLFLSFALLALATTSPALAQDPYEKGEFIDQGMIREVRPDGEKSEILSIAYPKVASNFPVLFFVGGLQGLTSYIGYTDIIEHIVSHGFVLVGMSTFPDGPDDELNAKRVAHAIEWLSRNLNSTLESQVPGLSADLDRVSLMGHSAGCKVLTRFLKNGCSFSIINPKSITLIDPVDGNGPWGIIKDLVIEDGEILPFSIPTLMIGTGLGPIPGRNITIGPLPWPSCAPEGVNYPHFYGGYQCNKWLHVTENFGHADMMDPAMVFFVGLTSFCGTNQDAGAIGFNQYRAYVGGAATALARATTMDQPEMYKYLEQRNLIPRADMIGIVIDYDTKCSGGTPQPGCFDVPT